VNIPPLVAGREMECIYSALSEINAEEVKEAVLQKNSIKQQHIFDVLSARGQISYKDIFSKLKEVSTKYIDNGQIIFCDSASFISIDGDISYYNYTDHVANEKHKTLVNVNFMPVVSELSPSVPMVILPKNEYQEYKLRRDRGMSSLDLDVNTFFLEDIVEEAIARNISDVHITYSDEYYFTSFRVDGDLVNQPKYLLSKLAGKLFQRKIKQDASAYTKGGFNADEHDLAQGARIEYARLGADTRLAFTPRGTLTGENALTIRILVKQKIDKENFSFKNMGYDDDFVELLEIASHLSSGLILVCGITGSGKSTLLSHFTVTLPSIKRIMTFEDPIEYEMAGSHITQHQRYMPADESIAFDFSDGIKSSKRSDPDVIYIGEVRKDKGNNSLVESLVESAKAGQLVLSTVHINSAYDIYRSMETVFGVSTSTSSDLLLLTINQILVKKLCPYCKIKDIDGVNKKKLAHADEIGNIRYAYKDKLNEFLKEEDVVTYIRNPSGCKHCRGGVSGRKPIYEFLKPDVDFIEWLGKGNFSRFAVEKHACSQNKKFLAKNKLTNYIEALIRGEVDADDDVMDKLLS